VPRPPADAAAPRYPSGRRRYPLLKVQLLTADDRALVRAAKEAGRARGLTLREVVLEALRRASPAGPLAPDPPATAGPAVAPRPPPAPLAEPPTPDDPNRFPAEWVAQINDAFLTVLHRLEAVERRLAHLGPPTGDTADGRG
jgi:hypothetical protein